MSAAHRDFLVEIGTEELPPKSLLTLATGIGANRSSAGGLRGKRRSSP